MVIRIKSLTKEQFLKNFESLVRASASSEVTFLGVSITGKYEGSVNGDQVILIKRSSILSNLPQRQFYGRFLYENGVLSVKGRFRFPKTFYTVLTVLTVLFFSLMISTQKDVLSMARGFQLFILSVTMSSLLFFVSLLVSLVFEKETVKALETL